MERQTNVWIVQRTKSRNCTRDNQEIATKRISENRNWIYSNHHHHVALVARISLTLSRHSSQSYIALGRSSGQHPVSPHSYWMYVRAGRPAFARPCVGVYKSTSLMSSSETTHGDVRRGWGGQNVAVFVRYPTPSHTQTFLQ